MYISIDDKAYLRPGTDVGFRVVRNKKLYDVTENSLQKRLPQHDFCNPDLHQTPSSFRLVKGHLQSIDGSQKMIHDFDQTLVMVDKNTLLAAVGQLGLLIICIFDV